MAPIKLKARRARSTGIVIIALLFALSGILLIAAISESAAFIIIGSILVLIGMALFILYYQYTPDIKIDGENIIVNYWWIYKLADLEKISERIKNDTTGSGFTGVIDAAMVTLNVVSMFSGETVDLPGSSSDHSSYLTVYLHFRNGKIVHFADEGYINTDEVKDYLRKRINQENRFRHVPA